MRIPCADTGRLCRGFFTKSRSKYAGRHESERSQRFAAAFFAISARRSGDMLLALAAPPLAASAFAAWSLPSSGSSSDFLAGRDAHDLDGIADHSAGRFSPLGPVAILRFDPDEKMELGMPIHAPIWRGDHDI